MKRRGSLAIPRNSFLQQYTSQSGSCLHIPQEQLYFDFLMSALSIQSVMTLTIWSLFLSQNII